jgi:hypothetical protein
MEKAEQSKRSCRVLATSKRTQNMRIAVICMTAVFDLRTVLSLADRRCK